MGIATADVLHRVVRRWYLALLGLLITLGAMALVAGSDGVYETRADLHFLPPKDFVVSDGSNPVNDLVAIAGLVEREVNQGERRPTPASPDTWLAGMGVEDGTSVVLPNQDGQFGYSFHEPYLRVQAVGATADRARTLRTETVAEIEQALARVQAADGVPERDRVRTRLVPRVPPVLHRGGAPRIAIGVSGLLGLVGTGLVCVHGDRLLRKRSRSRQPEDSALATTA